MLSFLMRRVGKLEVCSQALSFKVTTLVVAFKFLLAAFFPHGAGKMASSLGLCQWRDSNQKDSTNSVPW